MKKVFLIALFAIAMSACSDNMIMNEPEMHNANELSRSSETSTSEYTVTPDMVCKYINLYHKDHELKNLTSIIRDGDTLAYVAEYQQGWDFFTGDKRMPPIMIMSETGNLNFSDNGEPDIKGLTGALKLIKNKKYSNDTIKDPTWHFLEPPTKKENVAISRSGEYGEGMWIPIDTIIDFRGSRINHILETKWGQYPPWDQYTPYISGEHSVVGCVAVATAQQIYHFRKNNNRGITLPLSATYSDYENGTPSFSNFSTSGWCGLANSLSDTGTDKVSMFMSYIGQLQNLDYGLGEGGTSGQNSVIFETLNQFKLTGTVSNNYSYEKLISNLKDSIPVILCASYNPLMGGHAFNVDGYTENIQLDYVSYYWDPDYRITLDDLHYVEDWRFQEPVSYGTTENKGDYKEYHNNSRKYVYIRMNWGYSGDADDTSFLAYYYSGDGLNINESVYSPDWTIVRNYQYKDGETSEEFNYVYYAIYDCAEMAD